MRASCVTRPLRGDWNRTRRGLPQGGASDQYRRRTLRPARYAGRSSGTARVWRQQGAGGIACPQVETARSYGVAFTNIERAGRVRPLLRRRGLPPRAGARQTGSTSVPRSPDDHPQRVHRSRVAAIEAAKLDQWRADVLDRVDTSKLPEHVKNRIWRDGPRFGPMSPGQAKQNTTMRRRRAKWRHNAPSMRWPQSTRRLSEEKRLRRGCHPLAPSAGSAQSVAPAVTPAVTQSPARIQLHVFPWRGGQTHPAFRQPARRAAVRTWGIVWSQSQAVNPAQTCGNAGRNPGRPGENFGC